MRGKKTGHKDRNGTEIYENDIFKWTIPKGFRVPDLPYSPFLYLIAFCLSIEYNEITEDVTTISRVVYKDGKWILVGIGEDRGWETVLCGTIDRTKYGIVIGNIDIKPELLEENNEVLREVKYGTNERNG